MPRHLLPVLRRLLDDYGLADARLRTLSSCDEVVLRVLPRTPLPGIPAGGAVLRVYAAEDDDDQAIDSDINWLREMAAAGLHVPCPIADRHGCWRREVRIDDGAPRATVLVGWVDGRFLDVLLTPARMLELGRLAGAMHAHADRLDAAGALPSRDEAYTGDLPVWASGEGVPETVPAGLRTLAGMTAQRLLQELQALPRERGDWGYVHGDLHAGNYLFRRAEAGCIDFGACGRGPRGLDLAGALQVVARPMYGNHDHRTRYPAMRDALLSGYAESTALTAAIERQADLCAVIRVFVTLSWMVWDWPHPRHYAWGPDLLRGAEQVFRSYLDG